MLRHRTVVLALSFSVLSMFLFSLEQQEVVLLSFDVEPVDERDSVESILDILHEFEIPATFFVTGEYAEQYPNTTRRIVLEGHEIGCHSYSHTNFRSMNRTQKTKELQLCIDIIRNITGMSMIGFRAPYNRVDDETFEVLQEFGFLYDASLFSNLGWFYPDPEDVGLLEVPISTHFLIPLEDVIWLHYLHIPESLYFWILKHKYDQKVSSLFHPHHLLGRENAFRSLLTHLKTKNVTFINHYSEVISKKSYFGADNEPSFSNQERSITYSSI